MTNRERRLLRLAARQDRALQRMQASLTDVLRQRDHYRDQWATANQRVIELHGKLVALETLPNGERLSGGVRDRQEAEKWKDKAQGLSYQLEHAQYEMARAWKAMHRAHRPTGLAEAVSELYVQMAVCRRRLKDLTPYDQTLSPLTEQPDHVAPG